MTYVLHIFILRLRLRPMAKGRSLSGPNIRLQLKVKIAPTVQHCKTSLGSVLTQKSLVLNQDLGQIRFESIQLQSGWIVSGLYLNHQEILQLSCQQIANSHNTYTRNIMCQKCEGICGLWVPKTAPMIFFFIFSAYVS